ncbi:hypothetical protein TNCT_283861 [Trichonephila clavata]|uniref:Uncharacterized protein n=1 Tax=Trichonephila clavata TaxID=2740835 RepID=A0A8X6LLC9_TRICU|nr:hypothetical protein TNCT_283861 [Trichonephila clavata]
MLNLQTIVPAELASDSKTKWLQHCAHGKRRCLTLEETQEYFHEVDGDDISESSSVEDNEHSGFTVIPPDPDELTNEEDFDEDLLGENSEIPKDM